MCVSGDESFRPDVDAFGSGQILCLFVISNVKVQSGKHPTLCE